MSDSVIHHSRYISNLSEKWSNNETNTTLRWLNGPEGIDAFVCEVAEQSGKPVGWLYVDSTVQGRSHGGVRLGRDVNISMMERLARRMTLKFGFVGVANGGAKAGIIGDPEGSVEDRQRLLKRFSKGIAPVLKEGHYAPHPDLGTSTFDIEKTFDHQKLTTDFREPSRELSGFMTSLSVIVSAERAARFLGKSLNGMTAAVEGFGKVGSAVAQGLQEKGVKIVAISTSHGAIYNRNGLNLRKLRELNSQNGSDLIQHYTEAEHLKREKISALPVDLFCPCARESVNTENAGDVAASIISPGANCPVDDDAEQILSKKGILYVPDFVANSGGVLGGTMFYAGLTNDEIRDMMDEHFGNRITNLLEDAKSQNKSLTAFAADHAMDRFKQIKKNAEQHSIGNLVFGVGLDLYRKGVLPKFVTRSLAKHYFQSKVR